MRSKLDDVGQVTGEFLPLWMRSVQSTGNSLGWTPAVPIAYCQPGESAQVKYNIEKRGIDIRSLPFSFNELIKYDVVYNSYLRSTNKLLNNNRTL